MAFCRPPLNLRVAFCLFLILLSGVILASCGGSSSSAAPSGTNPSNPPGSQASSGTSVSEVVYVATGSQILSFAINSSSGFSGAQSSTAAPPYVIDMKVDPSGRFLYLSDFNVGQVRCYAINSSTGGLSEINGSPFGPVGPGTGNGGPIAIDPQGKFLFFSSAQGDIRTFAINASDGSLSLTGLPISNTNQPIQLVVDPAGKFLYSANHADFSDARDISVYSIGATGALQSIPGSPFSILSNSQPYGLAIDPTGKFLFVALWNAQKVAAMKIDSNSGGLSPVAGSPYTVGFLPQSLTMTPSGNLLYVGNTGDSKVSAFQVDPASGALTPVSGSPFFEGNPSWLIADTTGNILIVAESSLNKLSLFSIGGSGALTRIGSTPAGSSATAMAVFRLH
jgi:6-phosphogluconolactonase (cycloisomerase 2 family)